MNIFRPVRGTEEAIKQKKVQDGYIYFAYDTGKIYLDKDGSRHLMGGSGSGSSSIIYAHGTEEQITKVDPEDELSTEYSMKFDALDEPDIIPLKDNLILNSDGRFFRIVEVDLENRLIYITLLSVSGNGSGEGVVQQTVDIQFDKTTIQSGSVYIYGVEDKIVFTPVAINGNTDAQGFVTITIEDNEDTSSSPIINKLVLPMGKRYEFNTKDLPLSEEIRLTFNINSDNSGMKNGKNYYFTISTVDMRIAKYDPNSLIKVIRADSTELLTLDYVPVGSSKLNEILHVYIDGVEFPEYRTTIPAGLDGGQAQVAIQRQSHGAHVIELSLSTTLNGTQVETPKIQYEGAWATLGDNSPIVWLGPYDKTVINYEPAYINFMIYDPETAVSGGDTTVQIYQEARLISEMDIRYRETGWYTIDISSRYNVGDNNFSISCRGTKIDLQVFVTTQGARDLSLCKPESLILNYTSAGKSNDEVLSSRSVWENMPVKEEFKERSTATLSDFNWKNNGWKRDTIKENEVDIGTYLSIANGSKLSITCPSYIMNANTNYAFEIRFRVKNVQQYSTIVTSKPRYFYITETGERSEDSLFAEDIEKNGWEIATDSNGYQWIDEDHYDYELETEKGVFCRWLNSEGQGICIGTQEAYFKSPNGPISVKYKEDEVISLTFVIVARDLIYVYLNGILSGAGILNEQTSNFTINSNFEFNSEYCDVDLFRLRVYTSELTMPQVIHNYLADLHSTILYDQNQLTETYTPTELEFNKLIKYNKEQVENHNVDGLTMPYCVWKINDTVDTTERLPYFKGNARKVDIIFVNPTADYLLENNLISEWEYYTGSPSFTASAVDIDVQGTTSQGYPRRNYKTKFKKAENWVYAKGSLAGKSLTKKYTVLDEEGNSHELSKKFHMDNEYVGTNKFTWKIDYMESSGMYNTGFANMMGNKEQMLYPYHPLSKIGMENDAKGLRTNIYGYPVLVFHEYTNSTNNPTNTKSTYEYIGRYNMNLDKGSNEYYGFEVEKEQPYLPIQDFEIEEKQEDGTTIKKNIQRRPYVSEIAECWELSDNQGTWCSFRFPDANSRSLGFRTPQAANADWLEILNHFEYRYNFYDDQLDGISDDGNYTLADKDKQNEYWSGASDKEKSEFAYQRYTNLEKVFRWLDSTDTTTATGEDLVEPVTYKTGENLNNEDGATSSVGEDGSIVTTFTKDTVKYRLAKFKNEFDKHFDLQYCMIYFLMTELFLCFDSRGKNMMIASWGPQEEGGDYIWYPIFYDIDTQLGINNSGAPLWDYDADVTEQNIFSTPNSVLWNNLWSVFRNEIEGKYITLRNGPLNQKTIIGAYECNPEVFNSLAMRGIRPVIAMGLDSYYKYLAPRTHYFNTTGKVSTQKDPPSAMQGDKKLSFEAFLSNRLNYIDSWFRAGEYTLAQGMQMSLKIRANANTYGTSDTFLDLPEETLQGDPTRYARYSHADYPKRYFDAQPGFQVKPFLKQYVYFLIDDNTQSESIKYLANADQQDGIRLKTDSDREKAYRWTENVQQQVNYLPGLDQMSSIGDLSLTYLDELYLFGGKKLIDLILGSDVPGYFNNLFKTTFVLNAEADNPNKKALLKKVVLTNLTELANVFDLTGSEKLQEFRALNTKLPQVYLASGVPIHTLHLPKTIQKIELKSAENLTRILRTAPVVGDYDSINNEFTYRPIEQYQGLYIEGITDYEKPEVSGQGEGHSLRTLIIENGQLGYDSYELLHNLVDIKMDAKLGVANNATISLEGVKWSPYEQVAYGENYKEEEEYYYLNDHGIYTLYTYTTSEQFNDDTNNGLLYTYRSELAQTSEQINSLEIFDIFISVADTTQFTNPDSGGGESVPTITGELYVNNTEDNAIEEDELTSKYKVYFPRLNITAKYIKESNIAKYVEILPDTNRVRIIETNRTKEQHPLHPSLTTPPTRANHDFKGWATDAEGNNIIIPYNKDTGYPSEEEVNNILSTLTFDDTKIITFYAIFEIQQFEIKYYMSDKLTEYLTSNISYGSLLTTPNRIPYKNDIDLALTKKYKFEGYSLVQSDMDLGYITQEPPTKVFHELTLYPVFSEASVYDDILDEEYLTLNSAQILSFKSGYVLSGKITLPNTYKGTIVKGFGQGQRQDGVTHIFWDNTTSNSVTSYTLNAFEGYNNLIYVEIPNDNFTIGARVFQNCPNLFKNEQITQTILDDFFGKITSIYELGFNSTCGNHNTDFANGKTVNLPNIKYLDYGALSSTCIGNVVLGSTNNYLTTTSFNNKGEIFSGTYFNNNGTTELNITIYSSNSIDKTSSLLTQDSGRYINNFNVQIGNN